MKNDRDKLCRENQVYLLNLKTGPLILSGEESPGF
ncbi:MAG: hypothetical protein UV09_C0004G0012 [Candidatus Gottesmanbacteria bacterium GW2011_GWA2_42_18]|uniref:Uncharacterized protein n=1 Tax=Candidatus Gottesmanbacteria bacterium GW2011_GWA2_42_18 TaxID=1618442 RepID=A0A0G1CD08_9BACT|nr:MAG: hypothetical protein UV09_C0004G0012 [Candidatus Gottesmanbacteria bacterium GW2011_GWA2_42_18]